jgi:anti-sigma28 factor (negative regulator of flagellin synthesis)
MINDRGNENEPQAYKDASTYKNELKPHAEKEIEPPTQHSYTDRLTKLDAIRLNSEIRTWVPAILGGRILEGDSKGVTVEEVCAVFSCKYNFARTRLKKMVQEGILRSEGGQGSLVEQYYLANPENFTNTEDFEDASNNASEEKEETQKTSQDEEAQYERSQSNDTNDNALLIAIKEINKKIEEIKAKILRGEQKIQNLEMTKKLLIEDDPD